MEQSSKQMIAYVLIELKSLIGTVIVTVEDTRVCASFRAQKQAHTYLSTTDSSLVPY